MGNTMPIGCAREGALVKSTGDGGGHYRVLKQRETTTLVVPKEGGEEIPVLNITPILLVDGSANTLE